jgi:penicillin-binding protein 2
MGPRTQTEIHVWRIALLGLAMLALLGVLVARLWSLQVARSGDFQRRLERQSLRSVRLPGVRGEILDRNGVPMAENRPSYCLSLYPEEIRKGSRSQSTADQVIATLDRLAECMDLPRMLTAQDVKMHLNRRTPLELVAWRDLSPTHIARYVEHSDEFPGTKLDVEPVRVYPGGKLACHLLGYIGRAAETNLPVPLDGEGNPERYNFYLPEMVGRSGIEKSYNGVLQASDGGKLELQVDVAGFKFDEKSRREPGHGGTVTLAIDTRIQKAAEDVLAGQRGAAVVVDPRNGDVLALASVPGYDPNAFVPAIPAALWKQMLSDTNRPLFNRAVMGEYAPGSTFKPVTLLAALGEGAVTPATRFDCPGRFDLGSAVFRCWQSWGHGTIDLRHAVRYSCNVYLFHSALLAGAPAVQRMARACGFGSPTGIALDAERPGLVPDNAWKRQRNQGGWRDGDTCNLAIGQGALLATPLQQALYCAALANGGTLWRPRLVLGIRKPGGVLQEIGAALATNQPAWKKDHIAAIREGMRDVVNASDGSGRRARLPYVTVAGKTGTAEYGIKGAGRKMTWFIGFAPYDSPRYAFAMLVEDGASGGSTVAPKAMNLLDKIFREVEGLGEPEPAPAPAPAIAPPAAEPAAGVPGRAI